MFNIKTMLIHGVLAIKIEVLIPGILAIFALAMGFSAGANAELGDDESVPPGFECVTKAQADAEGLFCLTECDDDDDDDDDNGVGDCNLKECELDGVDDGDDIDDGVVCAIKPCRRTGGDRFDVKCGGECPPGEVCKAILGVVCACQ